MKAVPGRILALALLAAFAGSLVGCKRPVPAQLETSPGAADSSPTHLSSGKYGDFQEIFADVAAAALPAVVSIRSDMKVSAGDASEDEEAYSNSSDGSDSSDGSGAPDSKTGSRHEEGLGSGVIIDSDGTILTNNHVIEGADRIQVQLYDDREFDAEILGADPPSDLAVIRIKNARESFPIMPLGNSDALRVGEWVLAVGSPYGLSQTVTTGIISAKGRHNTGIDNYENFLQTDAAINPGNSGGALVNLRGELVGINTAIFSRSGGYQGIGFAIPINMARKISADLIAEGTVTRGWLGVSVQLLDPDRAEALGVKDEKGAAVGGVVPGGPADKAGIQRGDVIVRIDQTFIEDPNDLLNDVALRVPGTWAEVEVNRNGKRLLFKARIAKRDESRVASLQKQGN